VPEPSTEERYRALLRKAARDENVVGVVLVGSQAVGRPTPSSDYDVCVVTLDPTRRYRFRRGGPVESWTMTLAEFRGYALPGSGIEAEYDRGAFIRARVDLDKLDGEVGRLVREKATLTADEPRAAASWHLDGYVNLVYRSLKSWAAGRQLEARLDAAESIPYLLTALFALDRRVRPFNKWLVVEIEREPLPIPALLARIEAIRAAGEPAAQRQMFRDVEALARQRGHGAVIDGWEPNLAWLRGTPRRPVTAGRRVRA
jgi:predicted nucleotidyltransferase